MKRTHLLLLLLLLVNLAGCGGTKSPTETMDSPVAATVTLSPTGPFSGTTNSAISDSLSVLVLDANGQGVGGVDVAWETLGGSSVSPATVTTGADGTAKGQWTLSNEPGVDSVAAMVGSLMSSYATASVVWTLSPGRFTFNSTTTASSGAETSTAATQAPGDVTFDLGDVKNTTKYQFILQNGGDLPITDIQLSTSDATVEIFPTAISELGSAETTAIIPIVTVTVVHGTQPSGIGQAAILAQGAHQQTMTVTGATVTETGDPVALELIVTLDYVAKVASVEVIDGLDPTAAPVDLPSSVPGAGTVGGRTAYTIYATHSYARQGIIRNNGNVALGLRRWLGGNFNRQEITPALLLQPGDTALLMKFGLYNIDESQIVEFDPLGVVWAHQAYWPLTEFDKALGQFRIETRQPQRNALEIENVTPPGGRVGEVYSFELRGRLGWHFNYVWSITAGSLPPGLSLVSGPSASEYAHISGTPTAAGSSTITVTLVSSSFTATRDFTITIQ